jgi:hypothetical protein
MRATRVGDWRGARQRRILVFEKGLDGAGRFSFLNIPHPVMAADVDMNFGNLDRPEGNASSNEASDKPGRPATHKSATPAPDANSVSNATSNEE